MTAASKRTVRGMEYSAILHGVLLLLLIFGLPGFLHRNLDAEPMAISVDILPVAPMSNVKPQERTPEKEEKKHEEKKETARKETPETTREEEKADEAPIPVSAKDVVKQEKKKEKKKPKKKEESLESVLKSVQETAKAEESKKPTEAKTEPNTHEAVSQNYNPDVPLSMSEKDAIRNQFQKCWDVPAGARDAYNLIVTLHIEVNEDGSVTKVELVKDGGRYNSDSFFRAAADSAMRAVNRCSPLKNLPADKYGGWRDMELTFDPKEMLY